MFGYMVCNEARAGERMTAGDFVGYAVKRARVKLGRVPEVGLVHIGDQDSYGAALEQAGVRSMAAPWILPHTVYLVKGE